MRALTWQATGKVRVEEVPDPRIEDPRMQSSGSRRRRSAARICTCMTCSARSSKPEISSGTSRWASWRKSDRGHVTRGRRPRRHPLRDRLRRLLHVRKRPPDPVRNHPGPGLAEQRAEPVRVHRSCTARCRVGRRSTSASRRADDKPSRSASELPDERYLYLCDILPTAWQGVQYAERARGRNARRVRSRPGRPVRLAHWASPRASGDRGRPVR